MGLASFLTLICLLNFNHLLKAENTLQTYIVHVEAQPSDIGYDSFFATDAADSAAAPPILHRYRHVLTGFAARLSADELESLRLQKGFISARPERVYELHTTHSPSFLGLNQNAALWKGLNYGKGVVIGLLDTGITPGHPSFHDDGMPAPPAKWKGKCELGAKACNNKLIGARAFGGGATPADEQGHGTHTAATAGGNFAPGASIFGSANGTAAGVAPRAHVAMYKVCSPAGCAESDIIAGMDAAIDDGVDVLSLSLGGQSAAFYSDNIAVGAYRAMEKGILTVCSAGNSGPEHYTLSNEAPWILTVGAATIDRRLTATVVLGNGEELNGESAFQPRDLKNPATELEIVYPNGGGSQPSICQEDELKQSKVKGKIVVCDLGLITRTGKGVAVKNAGGAAMILMNSKAQGYTLSAEAHALPASHITYADTLKLKAYLNSTKNPKARILFKGTVIGDKHAPTVTYFSSRGPSVTSPGILKPDIVGPGNNILAAWNRPVHNTSSPTNKANFNMISGTSMSCPHLSGAVALLKSAHPDWSPAAIKSAIMTTADLLNLAKKPIEDQTLQTADIFAKGAGHLNPAKANDPGLVYDLRPDDYIPYLCGLKLTSEQVGMIVHRTVECSSQKSIPEAQLNYPSFSIRLGATPQTYTRTVTNVGEAKSVYKVRVVAPKGVAVKVEPTTLRFSKVRQKLGYSVTFSPSGGPGEANVVVEGEIKWSSGKRRSVRSPVAVMFG